MPHFYISEGPMKTKARVLVMGATGQVGGALVPRLVADQGVEVVAAARTPAKAKHLGVEVVEFDLDRIDTFAPALEGIDRIFMATVYTVDMLRQSKDLVNSAKRAGVQQIVHLGACGDEFLKGTMAALATEADEIMVPHASSCATTPAPTRQPLFQPSMSSLKQPSPQPFNTGSKLDSLKHGTAPR